MRVTEQEGNNSTAVISAEPTGTGSRGEKFLGKQGISRKDSAAAELGLLTAPNSERNVYQRWSTGHDNRRLGAYRDVNPDFDQEELASGRKIFQRIFEENGINNSRDKKAFNLQLALIPLIGADVRNFETFEKKIKKRINFDESFTKFRDKKNEGKSSVFIHSINNEEEMFITSTHGIGERDSKILIDKREEKGLPDKNKTRLTLEEILKDRLHKMYGISDNPEAIEFFDGRFSNEIGYMTACQRRVLKILHHYKPEIKEVQRQSAEDARNSIKSEAVIYKSSDLDLATPNNVQTHMRVTRAA